MHRAPEYILLFIALALLQAFLISNLNLGIYVHPLVYAAFVILLPMETKSSWVLLLGLAMGLTVDFLTAGAGLHTIAMLATAFVRRGVLVLFVSRETVDDGGAPCAARIGAGKFVRYAAAMLLLHCSVYFLFEAFGFSWMHLLAVKILLSMLATLALTWVLQLFFNK